MKCTIVKEVWDKLRSIYEGNDEVKKSKLKTLLAQFESVKMKEEEDVSTYFLRVDEIVNSITGLGALIKEKTSCAKYHENYSYMVQSESVNFRSQK